MKRRIKIALDLRQLLFAIIVVTISLLSSCASLPEARPFYSDGCSLFPDGTPVKPELWCNCCFAHDIAYWRGGSEEDRLRADVELKECVQRETGNAALGRTMYSGVRAGGSPVFPNWYRWGYGWAYGRGYEPLTPAEEQQLDNKLVDYLEKHPQGYCSK